MPPAKRDDLTSQDLRELAAKEREAATTSAARAKLLERLADIQETTGRSFGDLSAVRGLIVSAVHADGDPFITTALASGYSLNTLAAAVGVSPAMLAAHRKPKGEPNSRMISKARAEAIETLIGWKADARHWPGGISPRE